MAGLRHAFCAPGWICQWARAFCAPGKGSFAPLAKYVSGHVTFCLSIYPIFYVQLPLLDTFNFLVLSCARLYCIADFVNCWDLFFVCDELAIKQFKLDTLIHQQLFNPISRSYVVYEFTIHHNQSYFNNYCLDQILPTKQTKNKWPWFLSGSYRATFQSSKIISPDIWKYTM